MLEGLPTFPLMVGESFFLISVKGTKTVIFHDISTLRVLPFCRAQDLCVCFVFFVRLFKLTTFAKRFI